MIARKKPNRIFSIAQLALLAGGALAGASAAKAATAMILAGDETGLPADTPSKRIDPLGEASPFAYVGAISIRSGSGTYRGTGSILSAHWVLTAGHNVDLDDDGQADAGLGITFHLQGSSQTWTASGFHPHPLFTGFSNPTVQHDLALLYFAESLPAQRRLATACWAPRRLSVPK